MDKHDKQFKEYMEHQRQVASEQQRQTETLQTIVVNLECLVRYLTAQPTATAKPLCNVSAE